MIQVRNESAENFLLLLKEWERLCVSYSLVESNVLPHPFVNSTSEEKDEVGGDEEEEDDDDSCGGNSSEVFEVEEVLAICYGDPKDSGAVGLYFKVIVFRVLNIPLYFYLAFLGILDMIYLDAYQTN